MWGFLVIMFSITIGFSLIFLEFGREEDSYYLNFLYATYQVWYGNIDDSEYTPSQKILTAMILFMLSVVLLNMLIAIMGNTYESVNQQRILTDTASKVGMYLEGVSYMRLLRRTSGKKGYLMFYSSNQYEEKEGKSDWTRTIEKVKEQSEGQIYELKKLRYDTKNDAKVLREEVMGHTGRLRDEVKKDVQQLNTKVGSDTYYTREDIKKFKEETKKDMQELREELKNENKLFREETRESMTQLKKEILSEMHDLVESKQNKVIEVIENIQNQLLESLELTVSGPKSNSAKKNCF